MADPEAPDAAAESGLENYDKSVVALLERMVEPGRWLAEAAIDAARWAPYVDWSLRLRGEEVTANERVLDAFHHVRRYDFLLEDAKPRAIADVPLVIGKDQTNSQPSTVAKMIDWLDPQPGQRVLDVGAGSGWTTGLLAHMVGEDGSVDGTERIEELLHFAEGNLAKYAFSQITLHHTPGEVGFSGRAPYDRILVSAGTPENWLPELFDQLSPDGGIMLAPVVLDMTTHADDKHNKQLWLVRRDGDEQTVLRQEDGYAFVPLLRGEEER